MSMAVQALEIPLTIDKADWGEMGCGRAARQAAGVVRLGKRVREGEGLGDLMEASTEMLDMWWRSLKEELQVGWAQ